MLRTAIFRQHALLVIACLILFTLQITAPALAAYSADVLTLVNQERTKVGVAPLTLCQKLTTAAQNHTDDMIARQFFSHTSPPPNSTLPWDRIEAVGYANWTAVGENISVGRPTPQDVVTGWMGSPGHKANILNPDYTHMGLGTAVGLFSGNPNARYWTQVFAAGDSCGGQNINLSVSISDAPDPVVGNDDLVYTVTVSNSGAGTSGQSALTFQLPAEPTFVSALPAQGICSRVLLIVSCDLGSIASSGSVIVTITITPLTAGTITATAAVASPTDFDTSVANNTASASTIVAPPPPDPPTLTAPLDEATALQPTFTWVAPAGAVRYEIQIGFSDPPTTTVINVTTTNYTPPPPMIPGNYFWRVRAFNSAGLPSDWSTASFELKSPTDTAPLLNYVVGQPIVLTWNRALWATDYDIEIANRPTMTNPVVQTSTANLFYPASTLTEGTYYWRVRGKTTSVVGAWSAVQSFVLKP